ncbi:BARH2 protein, partial [Melanocharis versteri]|nr:BARH2 protein [Melanocharis versteri]
PPPPSLQPSPPQPPPPQLGSASSGPRTSTSSFLIKDILGDSKPLAACAPYSTSVPSPHHTPKQEGSAAPESFRPKLEQEDGKAKLDKRDDTQGDIKCHGEYGPARLRTGSAACTTGAAVLGRIGETKIGEKICSRSARSAGPAKAARVPHRGPALQPPLAPPGRTKWKRQTAVGLELLAEAGNYSALQRMFPSPYFYHPSLLGSMDSTTAAAAAAALHSSMYRTPPAPHPQLQRPLVPRVLIHGLGPGGQPALNPLANPMPGTPHPR